MGRLTFAPDTTPLLGERGLASWHWIRWFQQVFQSVDRGQLKEIRYSQRQNGDLADEVVITLNRPYELTLVQQIHSTLGTDGSAVTVTVTKDTGTQAPGAGTALLTAGFNLKATANTVQEATLTTTLDNRKFSKGDRLAIKFSGVLTSVAGLNVTATLKPI